MMADAAFGVRCFRGMFDLIRSMLMGFAKLAYLLYVIPVAGVGLKMGFC